MIKTQSDLKLFHIVLAIILLALCFSAGSCVISANLSVSGRAVNVRATRTSTSWWTDTTTSLVGAVVTLKDLGSSWSGTATVGSNGKYKFDAVDPGRYTLSAVKTNWAFVPREVDISGYSAELPDLLGYIPTNANDIFIITEWASASVDVDSHLIIDDANSDALVTGTIDQLADVYCNYPSYGSSVILERDITPTEIAQGLPAVETVRIASNPFSGTDSIGWLRFYLNSYNSPQTGNGALTGNSATPIANARAKVHVMQGTAHFGSFALASETQETTMLVLKIQVQYSSGVSSYTIMSGGNFGTDYYRSVE